MIITCFAFVSPKFWAHIHIFFHEPLNLSCCNNYKSIATQNPTNRISHLTTYSTQVLF